MDVIIYGLGLDHLPVKKSIKSEHRIIGYCDNSSSLDQFYDVKFIKPVELHKYSYDCIIIAERNMKTADIIIEDLTTKYSVPREKIVNFYSCHRQRVDRVMDRKNPNGYDGIIFGISHGAKGINPACLKGNACNLSFSSQDLYYNFITLKHCVKHYYDKVKTLKYAIIDMYDYCYFNHDTSLHSGAMGYYSPGGYSEDEHNFCNNKRYHGNLTEELEKYLDTLTVMTKKERDLKEQLLDEEGYIYATQGQDFQFEEEKLINTITPDSEMPINGLFNGITKKKNPQSIQENIQALDDLFKLLYEINPDIRIQLVLIPRYFVVEQTARIFMKEWEEEFTQIIDTFKTKYKFTYLDLKNNTEISGNGNFYDDWGHLNYSGSIAFTSILNKYLEY